MYDPRSTGSVDDAVYILSNPGVFMSLLAEVMVKWPVSTEEHLTNTSSNRRAWCGQAACSYGRGVPETNTRVAWSMLTFIQQHEANTVANKKIKEYERAYRELHIGMGAEMLF